MKFIKNNDPSFQWQICRNYLDISLSPFEKRLIVVLGILLILLHLTPINHSIIAGALLCLLFFLAFLSPMLAFAIIPIGQFLLPAPGIPVMPAMLVFIFWLGSLFYVQQLHFTVKGIGALSIWIPYFCCVMIKYTYLPLSFLSSFFGAASTCLIVNNLVWRSDGRFLKCLLGFSAGCGMVCLAFWLNKLGLPVQLSQEFRDGMIRWGGLRASSAQMWYPIFIFFCGFYGTILVLLKKQKPVVGLMKITLVGTVGTVIPLIYTYTNTSFFGILIIVSFLFLLYIYHFRSFLSGAKVKCIQLLLCAIVLGSLCLFFNVFDVYRIITRWENTYHTSAEEIGILGTRDGLFQHCLQRIAEYPFWGRPLGEYDPPPDPIPSEYKKYGFYLSHNVFLDVGRLLGIPGIIAFGLVILYPILIWGKKSFCVAYVPFVGLFLATMIFLNILSFPWNKILWACWMFILMAAQYGIVNTDLLSREIKNVSA